MKSHAFPAHVQSLGATVQEAFELWDFVLLQVGNSGIVAEDCTTLVIWALKLVPFQLLGYPSIFLNCYLVAVALWAKLPVRQVMLVDASSARELVTPSTLQRIEHDH